MICNRIELLAPAADIATARVAIDAGADAIYIGGPRFSARAAASNSIEEIGELCRYAHLFGVKIYLAINTLIEPDERPAARAMVIEAQNAGLDAFIVQDMSFLAMDLPREVILHASTQCSNRSVERVRELHEAGFSRVVLERGLSLAQITEISSAVDTQIEVFVHGAICISYSGECYLSEHLCGRSANRGTCAQPCRSLYDLVDAKGKVLLRNEPLLSPKDLNLSNRLAELIAAGATSLKIEGRLKDWRYVANTVAYYNQKLNELGVQRTSNGVSHPYFTPDPDQTFTRGFTEYFFDGQSANLLTFNAPKGKFIGIVRDVDRTSFTLDRDPNLANGDGVATNRGVGVRINRSEGRRLFVLSSQGVAKGDEIYCNFFKNFEPRSERKIPITITFTPSSLALEDIYGNRFSLPIAQHFDQATDQGKAREVLVKNLGKAGDTIFEVREVYLPPAALPFIPIAQINSLRREVFALYELPAKAILRPEVSVNKSPINHPSDALLTTPLCPLYQYGMCLKTVKLDLPLTLVNNGRRISFEPHCGECLLKLQR